MNPLKAGLKALRRLSSCGAPHEAPISTSRSRSFSARALTELGRMADRADAAAQDDKAAGAGRDDKQKPAAGVAYRPRLSGQGGPLFSAHPGVDIEPGQAFDGERREFPPGWIAYWKEQRRFSTYLKAAERFKDRETFAPYNATLEDIRAGAEIFKSILEFEDSRGAGFPRLDILELEREEASRDPFEAPSAEIVARRNLVFADVVSYVERHVDMDASRRRKVLELDTKALVVHEPALEPRALELRDKSVVMFRPTERGDPRALLQFLEGMSHRSMKLRFPHLKASQERLAVHLVHEAQHPVASKQRRSFVAQDDKGQIVGFADYQQCDPFVLARQRGDVSIDGAARSCEMDLLVADKMQGKGLGRKMLEQAVQEARKEGYTQMLATVHDDNAVMRGMLRSMGITQGIRRGADAAGHHTYVIDLRTAEEREAAARARAIHQVQRRLEGAGCDVPAMSSKLDEPTQRALRQFQKMKGLPQTGLITQETLDALGVPAEEGAAALSR